MPASTTFPATAKRSTSSSLAIDGGKPAVTGPLARFNTIGANEAAAVLNLIKMDLPLSGYLGGELTSGKLVTQLEKEFAAAVNAKHAIAVNSATSGLLIACMAAGVSRDGVVATTPYTMSATAAAPRFLGARIGFGDIDLRTFCLDSFVPTSDTKAVIVTNLFGHPAKLAEWRATCDAMKCILIEDNAQAPFAMEGNRYAGTVGHIGVFSLNVHKHLQCGEGGICVTGSDLLADQLRLFRNHAELAGALPSLNLRMTEPTAAIALVQLKKRHEIISERIEIAECLSEMISVLPWAPPVVRTGCKHVYYCWALKVNEEIRDWVVDALVAEGVPLRRGYVQPLYELAAFQEEKPRNYYAVERANKMLALYENCAWTPTSLQLKQMGEAFRKVAGALSSGHHKA